MFASIPKGMLYVYATDDCNLDQPEVKKMFEDDFGYALRSYERKTGDDWSKLKKENDIK